MRFRILFTLAKARGLLPENHKYDVYTSGLTKSEAKELFDHAGWKPYRVTNVGIGFVTPN